MILNFDLLIIKVVIPTFNRVKDLMACLASLLDAGIPQEHLIVIDNHSDDDTAKIVEENYPSVQVIVLEKNLGAASASNVGFSIALSQGADYILRLDSDTVVARDFLEPLIEAGQSHPQVGVLSPKIYFFDHPEIIWYAGADSRPLILGTKNEYYLKNDQPETNRLRMVAFVWAAAMLIKREVLEKVNGFDQDFFIYHEEMDFCERIRSAGYDFLFVPNSFIWHKVGSIANSPWTAYHWNRSKMLLYRKHANNFFHKVFLIGFGFFYAFTDAVLHGLGLRRKSGNRGPLKYALQGFWAGLTAKISEPEVLS